LIYPLLFHGLHMWLFSLHSRCWTKFFCMRLTLLPLLFYLRECGAKLLAFFFLLFDIMHIDVGPVHDFIFQWDQGLIEHFLVRELFIFVQPPFLFLISFWGALHFSTLHSFCKMTISTLLTVGSNLNFNSWSSTHMSWLWLVDLEFELCSESSFYRKVFVVWLLTTLNFVACLVHNFLYTYSIKLVFVEFDSWFNDL